MDAIHVAILYFLFSFMIEHRIVTAFVRKENDFQFGNFVKNVQGFVLKKPDAFLTKTSAPSEDECMLDCLNHARCFSLNVVPLNTAKYECELFEKTGHDVANYLTTRVNSYYMKLQEPPSACDSNPCQHGGTCSMTDDRTNYTCTCRRDHKGRNCETRCILFDFEYGRLDGWTLTGTAFNNQPTYGDNSAARGRGKSNHKGNWWIGGYENRPSPSHPAGGYQGDRLVGTMTSPAFQIRGKQLTFLIGGGNDVNIERMELLIGGSVVAKETGDRTETMRQKYFNVTMYRGKTAEIRLVDNYQLDRNWGHINADHIVDSYCNE